MLTVEPVIASQSTWVVAVVASCFAFVVVWVLSVPRQEHNCPHSHLHLHSQLLLLWKWETKRILPTVIDVRMVDVANCDGWHQPPPLPLPPPWRLDAIHDQTWVLEWIPTPCLQEWADVWKAPRLLVDRHGLAFAFGHRSPPTC